MSQAYRSDRPRLGFGALQVLRTHRELLQPGDDKTLEALDRCGWGLNGRTKTAGNSMGFNVFLSVGFNMGFLMEIHGELGVGKLSL